MKHLQFSKVIKAPREKVWKILWGDKSYSEWTKAFSETSYAETDWKKGSPVKFTDGKGSGMYSEIADNRENEFMSFLHKGEIHNGVVDTTSDKVKVWAGALENYTLKDVNGGTELTIDIDVADSHEKMFRDMWPDALERLRKLCE